MGNQSTRQNFIKDQWQLMERTITHSVWRNCNQPNLHIEEHDRFVTDQYTYNTDKDIFQFRHNSPYLVAGIFFQQNQEHEFCSTNYKYRLFIEKVPLRLTDIQHIPFPDILHLYNQCLNGFHLLAQKLNYFFQVEQSYIGINERGTVKVWLSKYLANQSSIGGKISQQQMVRGIIDIVDKNSDPYQIGQSIPTLRNFLYRNSDTLNFEQAKRELQAYITTYNNGILPNKLDCVDHAGGAYFIANRPEIYHSQQSIIEKPYNQQYIHENSRYQFQRDQNRPQLVSNTNISLPDIVSQPSYQHLQYMPLAPLASIPNQLNLKGSEAFPQAHRQKVIVNHPVQVRQNMEVVRRRNSDYEKQFIQFPVNPPPYNINNMKYSQTLAQQMPLQSRHPTLSRNFPINLPVQNNIQINQTPMISTMPGPNFNRFDGPSRIENHSRPIAQPTHQITFKNINHNRQISSLSNPGNPSINLFSPEPSLLDSHQANFPSNPYIADQIKTISQKHLVAPLSSQLLLPENSRKQIVSNTKNNVRFFKTQTKFEKAQNKVSTYNSKPLEKNEVSSFEKGKEIGFNPQQNQLLASFNPAFVRQAPISQFQSQFHRPYVTQVTNTKIQGEFYRQKKSTQINQNDGKSSEQFLKQLREINHSFKDNQRPKSLFAPENSPITYSNGATYSKDVLKGLYQGNNLYSYEQIGAVAPVQSIMQRDDQEFGRNAVSNIIQNYENSHKNIYSFANTQPLQFQQGIAMKYSRLEADQPQQAHFKKYQYSNYEAKMDSDLMADLKKLKR